MTTTKRITNDTPLTHEQMDANFAKVDTNEISTAINAVNISTEETRAIAAESALTDSMTTIATDVSALDTRLASTETEIDFATASRNILTSKVNAWEVANNATIAGDLTLYTPLDLHNTQITTFEIADAILQVNIDANTALVAVEEFRATAAEVDNATAIALEATTARASEVANATAIALEATTARVAEVDNATAIALEATTARAAELTLNTNLAAEVTRAAEAESVLVGKLELIQTDLDTLVSELDTNQASAEKILKGTISSMQALNLRLTSERITLLGNKPTGDAGLDILIDAIVDEYTAMIASNDAAIALMSEDFTI